MRIRTTEESARCRIGLNAAVVLGLTSLLAHAQLPTPLLGQDEMDLVQYTNPTIGAVLDHNLHCFAGATVPFGMVQFSDPGHGTGTTSLGLWNISGMGCGYPHFGEVLPGISGTSSIPDYTKPRAGRSAQAGYYRVVYSDDVVFEATTTHRAACARFTFPSSGTPTVSIRAPGKDGFTIDIIGNNLVRFRQKAGWTMYYIAEFSRPFTGSSLWKDGSVQSGIPTMTGASVNAGVNVSFAQTGEPLVCRIGVSYVSAENALANLRQEIPGWDFDAVARNAATAWNKQLNKIQVTGGSTKQKQLFYSMLYKAMIHPNMASDVNGDYFGYDMKTHKDSSVTMYYNWSGWDIYRYQIPLIALLEPAATSKMMQALVVAGQQNNGKFERWWMATTHPNWMEGDPALMILAEAYAMGARGFNTRDAVNLMKGQDTRKSEYINNAYLPGKNVSRNLEHIIGDFCTGRLALTALGDTAVWRTYTERAARWRVMYDPARKSLRARDNTGAWGPENSYLESDEKTARWMLYHDLGTLVDTIGKDASVNILDTYTSTGAFGKYGYWFNEPNIHIPWVYNWAGAPWKSQKLIDSILTVRFDTTERGMPGDDDLGCLSSSYVFAAIGLMPVVPGVDGFVVTSPRFETIKLTLGNGRRISITGGASDKRRYIQSLKLNGKSYGSTWIYLDQLRDGSALEYVLSDQPNTQWGAGAADRPPLFTKPQPSTGTRPDLQPVPAPQPVVSLRNGVLELYAPEVRDYSVAIYNQAGKRLANIRGGSAPLRVGVSPAAGVYTVVIENSKVRKTMVVAAVKR